MSGNVYIPCSSRKDIRSLIQQYKRIKNIYLKQLLIIDSFLH